MEIFVVCFGVILLALILLGFALGWRYINYRETLALAEKGIVKPANHRGGNKAVLWWGIIIAALGLALCLGMIPLGAGTSYALGLGPWMLIGLVPLFFGLALVLIYILSRDDTPPAADQTRLGANETIPVTEEKYE